MLIWLGPEAAAALILHSFRKPKRVRTAFTPAQLLKLENAFEKNHYVVGQERKELARHLNLTETQVSNGNVNEKEMFRYLHKEVHLIDWRFPFEMNERGKGKTYDRLVKITRKLT